MLSRIRKAMDEKDQGFTLIELLVVMIIIGILAAIAIPVFLSQREKAQDSAAKADVSTIGKEIATYYVDGAGVPAVTIVDARYVLNVAAVATPVQAAIVNADIAAVSDNVVMGATDIVDSTDWCVAVLNYNGDKAATVGYQYSAQAGLAEGNCGVAVPAAP